MKARLYPPRYRIPTGPRTSPRCVMMKRDGAYRSIIWTRADLEVERVPVESSDIAAVIVWLPHITILIISVYVQGADPAALVFTISSIDDAVASVK